MKNCAATFEFAKNTEIIEKIPEDSLPRISG